MNTKKGFLMLMGIFIVFLCVYKIWIVDFGVKNIETKLSADSKLVTQSYEKPIPIFVSSKIKAYYTMNKIIGETLEGEKEWAVEVPAKGRYLINQGIVIIQGNLVKKFDTRGRKVYTTMLEGEITHAVPLKGSGLLLEYSQERTRYITVLDGEGKPVFSQKQQDEYLLTGDYHDSEKLLVLSLLSIKDRDAAGRVVLLNQEGQTVWGRKFEDGLCGYVKFLSKDDLLAVFKTKLLFVDLKTGSTKEIDTGGCIKRATVTPEGFPVITRLTTPESSILSDNKTVVEMYDIKGLKQLNFSVSGFVEGMEVTGDKNLILFTDHTIYVVNLKYVEVVGYCKIQDRIIRVLPSENVFPVYVECENTGMVVDKNL